MEDEGLFDDEDEEETGALAMCVDLPPYMFVGVVLTCGIGATLRICWAKITLDFGSWVLLPSLGCRV